jgi:hypothetical protein
MTTLFRSTPEAVGVIVIHGIKPNRPLPGRPGSGRMAGTGFNRAVTEAAGTIPVIAE